MHIVKELRFFAQGRYDGFERRIVSVSASDVAVGLPRHCPRGVDGHLGWWTSSRSQSYYEVPPRLFPPSLLILHLIICGRVVVASWPWLFNKMNSADLLTLPLRPRFQLFPRETDSLRSCVCCHGKIMDIIPCPCGSCVYCSNKCLLNDFDEHKIRCDEIFNITRKINEVVDNIVHLPPSLQQNNLFEFGIDENDRVTCQYSVLDYFLTRQRLIEALVCDGLARIDDAGTIVTNKFALDIAMNECRNLFHLDKFDSYYSRVDGLLPKKEILMNLYLICGKYQELYNLCCFYAKHGERYFSHFSSDYIGDIGSPFLLTNQDVTKSFFQDNIIHHDNFPVIALNHMYVMKQILHEQMEGLRLINCHFLKSQDCVSAIGEYLGLKQEWIVLEKDWYSNQALEIVLPFNGCKATCAEFGKLYGFSELFFSVDHLQRKAGMIADFPHIDTTRYSIFSWSQPEVSTVNTGSYTASFSSCFALLSARAVQLQPSQCHTNHLPMWEETLRLCVEDHNYVCDNYIGHRFQTAVAKLNEIAGYDALSMNINHLAWTDQSKISRGYPSPKFVITRFVRNAIEICHKNLHNYDDYDDCYQFDQFIDYMDECDEGTLQLEYNSQTDFTYGIMIALVLERKIAQARYYISLLNGDADALLEKLPNGSNFCRVHPPPLDPNDPFITFPRRAFSEILTPDISDRIKLVSRWLTDVTDLIDALFKAGLATNENLSIIFGDCSIVSNTLWDLRKTKVEMSQQRLSNNESSLFPLYIATGLDIQSLSLAERTQRLEEARGKIIIMKSLTYIFNMCSLSIRCYRQHSSLEHKAFDC